MELDETWSPQIRQRKFQMHNQEWLEVVDEDEAEEYQDAVALNSAMALRVQHAIHQQLIRAQAVSADQGPGEAGDQGPRKAGDQGPGEADQQRTSAQGGGAALRVHFERYPRL